MAMDEHQSSEVLPSENGRELSENYREKGSHHHHHHHPQSGTTSFPAGFIGKHRLQAALTHLNNQISILQEELEKVETFGESSTVCKDTKGSVDAAWDRWFGSTHHFRNHKRWI
ncbi:hypothetical protein V8G54_035676 [Vigna mungo]|uniref:Uncharacterized protein n=1 Tax=Vigna mungo TaxID=3915 RepID=A0AAQ3REU0_VIGMU